MSDGLKMCVKARVTPGIKARALGAVSRGIRYAEIVDGDLILTLTDGSELNLGRVEGDPGAPGAQGIPGQDGADGITPTIGNNGNWYLGDTDTGKPSRGAQGEPGSDAEVTAENISAALGYTPISPAEYNPVSKTAVMTQNVGVDENGKLWTKPGGGGGGDAYWGGITGTLSDQTDLAAALAEARYDDTALSGRVSAIEGKEAGWDAKQNAISDLATIRAGASLGATALQEHQSLAAYRTASAQDAIDATKIGDAPTDGRKYSRQNGTWAEASTFSNPNLLDNGWFSVNQRGATTISSGYFVDRWLGTSNAVGTVAIDGITVTTGNIIQRLELPLWNSLIGKTVTASALLSNGTIVTATATMTASGASFSGGNFGLTPATNYGNFSYYGHSKTRAVKLEVGNVSTIASDAMPDYATELLKCQRYFWKTSNYSMAVRVGQYNANSLFAVVALPAPLRAADPSVSGTLAVKSVSGSAVDGFSFDAQGGTEGILRLRANKTGHGLTDGMISFAGMQITADL